MTESPWLPLGMAVVGLVVMFALMRLLRWVERGRTE